MFTGTLIKESLTHEELWNSLPLTNFETHTLQEHAADQPPVWHLAQLNINAEDVEEVAQKLSGSLKKGTWYVDFSDKQKTYVVFPGKVFAYLSGDVKGREEAQTFGRSIGIPEKQLDWKN